MLARVVLLCFIALTSALPQWVNENYSRSVELSKSYVKETVEVVIKNVDESPQSEYFFTLPNDGFDDVLSVAIFSVVVTDKQLVVNHEKVEEGYIIKLPIPLAKNNQITLKIRYIYLNGLTPLPSKIELDDTQKLLVRLNKYNYNPYETKNYTLVVSGVSKGQELTLHSEARPGSNSDVPELLPKVESFGLAYGPVADVSPYSVKPSGILYDHNRPLGRVVNLERSIWLPASVNTINQFQVEEYYELTNDGAGLNSGFSRVDWLKGKYEALRDHFALSHVEFPIREDDQFADYYFTDKVGMVSTHRKAPNGLLFQPRFPLFGGWFYNFTFGYNEAFDSHFKQLDEETYLVKVPIINTGRDLVYENVNLNFYLPENAEFVNISSPVEFNSISTSNEFSYLDFSEGHNKVTVNYSHLFEDLNRVEVILAYKLTSISYWYRVLKIAGLVFTALISYYALGLINVLIQ